MEADKADSSEKEITEKLADVHIDEKADSGKDIQEQGSKEKEESNTPEADEDKKADAETSPEAAPAEGAIEVVIPPGEHALQTGWCFWYDTKLSKHADVNEYKSHLHNLGAFYTIEDFWRYYVHLKRPSALDVNTNLYLFRHGENMVPMWESFPKGGCWILKIRKKTGTGPSVLGKLWQDLVLAAVGEAFAEPDVVGVAMSIRMKEDLLQVWNADNTNPSIRFMIGEKLKEILGLEPNTMIEYKNHFSSLQDMSTFRNAKPYVFAVQQVQPPAPPGGGGGGGHHGRHHKSKKHGAKKDHGNKQAAKDKEQQQSKEKDQKKDKEQQNNKADPAKKEKEQSKPVEASN